MKNIMKSEFMECKECASKPGSPMLCPSCYHNRALISMLTEKQNDKFFHIDEVDNWVRRYLLLCDHISTWSKDPSSQFGCVITNKINRPLSFGFNGFASGFKDLPERWNDRTFKYAHVIHAEENAILNANASLLGATAYVNGCPCSSCMSKLAQVGIDTIWSWYPTVDYLERWSIDHPMQVAKECGISVNFVKDPERY